MRIILAVTLGLLVIALATPSPAQTLAHFRSQRFGGTSSDSGRGIAVDGAGNVFVTGLLQGTANYGGTDLVSAGGNDIFLAKYDVNGVHQWSQRFGSLTGNDFGYAVAVDGAGNVVVTGQFGGTVNFGGVDLMGGGGTDIFVAKFNANGTHLWSKGFGGANNDVGESVTVDGSGNVLVTGRFILTVNFGGGDLVSAGSNDIFVAKFDASGTHLWSNKFGDTGSDIGIGIVTDGSGNVVVTGQFAGAVDFGGGALASVGSFEIFVAKFDASGAHLWSKRFGNTGADSGIAVAVDGAGNVAVTGLFQNAVDFGGGAVVGGGGDETFVAKFDASGTHLWSKGFGGASFDLGNGIAVDGLGNVVVTGYFGGTVDFGGGPFVGAGSFEIFVAKFDASGMHLWSQRFGSTADDRGEAVAVDGLVSVVVTGQFTGTVDFGGGNLVSLGSSETFVAKYASSLAEPNITSIADIGNDQGRKVKVRFGRSGFDGRGSPTPILQYEAFRRDDAPPAIAAASRDPVVLSVRELLDDGWTFAGEVPAHENTTYGIDVPTIGDSTLTAGQYYSVFFIRAATAAPGAFFDSAIDSGYSVDNLAPGVPSSFAYNAGVLSWNKSSAADFDYFSIYGSNSSSFGTATLVGYTTGTNLNVSSAAYAFYFVTATDFSGNEGKSAVINSLTGVGETPKNYVLSISSYPNPFNPKTTVRYTLPSKGRVTIAVFDLRGAHVATLVDQDMNMGAYTVAWNGRADRGSPASSGVYFARIVSPAGERSYKMTLLK